VATVSQRLAEGHRAAQNRLSAALLTIISQSYRQAIGQGTEQRFIEQWIAATVPLVLSQRAQSAALARVYLRDAGISVVTPEPVIREAVETSLFVTGWADLLQNLQRENYTAAIERAVTEVTGAADRHALNGGRDVVATSLQAQTDFGWYRITAAKPCSWCAMLASRGAVYGRDSFAESDPRFIGDGTVKVHDHCHCTLGYLPKGEQVPDRNASWRSLWDDVTKGLSGAAAQNAFRRAYESA
jgi:hypothetical protein